MNAFLNQSEEAKAKAPAMGKKKPSTSPDGTQATEQTNIMEFANDSVHLETLNDQSIMMQTMGDESHAREMIATNLTSMETSLHEFSLGGNNMNNSMAVGGNQ